MSTTTSIPTTRSRRGAALLIALACALATLLAAATVARAEYGLLPGSFEARVLTRGGETEEQAGGVPFTATTSFAFRTAGAQPDGDTRDISVELPPGFIGNPQALPRCTGAQFANLSEYGDPGCAPETQVGVVENMLYPFPFPIASPIYNLVPAPGHPAAFGFTALGVTVVLTARVRPEDHGLTIGLRDLSPSVSLVDSRLTFWGVPADPAFDGARGDCLNLGGTCPSTAPRKAFLSNPTTCEGAPPRTTLRVRSWQDETATDSASYDQERAPHDCDRPRFDPTIEVAPDTTDAGVPAGYTVRLAVPQEQDPADSGAATPDDLFDDVVSAHLRDAVVTLPAGTTVSPSSADGLGACAPGQIRLDDASAPDCPEASKIGTVEIDSPLMDEPMTGGIFLARQTPQQLLSLYLVAAADGVRLKLPGAIDPDPVTGQLTARFLDNPQLPFRDLTLRFKGGPRAPLTNPVQCGTARTDARLTAWSGKQATASSSFEVGGGCAGTLPFAPAFEAGTKDATAGGSSPFTLRLTRGDGEQELGQLQRVSLPPGLVGKVGTVPLCQEAQAAAGTCGAESRVGGVTVGSGAGANPFHLPGQVYMTTGYKGAPFGMSIVVPALAGPFDLGTVVVRAAVLVNDDASITVDADPLPTILKGIPLKLRSIALTLDRPGFMINPTNCAPMSIGASTASVGGTVANASARYQAGNCAALPFEPTVTAEVERGGSDGARLHVRVAQTPGQSNARSIGVTLPSALAARLAKLQIFCQPEQAAADACPANTRIGTAEAVTPVLSAPLRGDAFYVKGANRLPDVLVQLRGEVAIDLRGTVVIDSKQMIRTTFGAVPDVPLASFDLRLDPGEQSALQIVTPLCDAPLPMPTVSIGQNGKRRVETVPVSVTGCALRARASARRGAKAAAVVVTAPAAGTVTLSGKGLKTVRRTVTRVGKATFSVPLSRAGRRIVARRGALRTTVTVRLAPRSGAAASATAKVTLRKAKAPKRKSGARR